MSDYKNTLNLPKTDFPMKANLANREPAQLAHWQSQSLYQRISQATQSRKPFILHDGPPYANGDIHLGHAVNKILKDIVCKSKRLSGFNAPYVPGWDCHGLPIELNVEKKIGKVGKVTASEFRQACRDYAASQVKKQSEAFQRLGILGDWDHPYLTMDPGYEAQIIRALKSMIANGHLHQGYKPVHWCTQCGSALAEAEVEYKEKTSPSIDVCFRIVDQAAFAACMQVSSDQLTSRPAIIIWTTTPWTLPANEAVALNPKYEYVLVKLDQAHGTDYIVLAAQLLEATLARYGITAYEVMGRCQGDRLSGLLLQHPFLDKTVPVVLGEHVTLDAGTGAVHTAPAHGLDDFILAKRYDLPVTHTVQANGCFDEGTLYFANMHIFKANDSVIAQLKSQHCLMHMADLKHSYPHCWRHKIPLIFRATPQWFISMDQENLREKSLKAIEQVQWHPSWGQTRMHNMIVDRPDWCISRQREWGVPIPLFVHKKTGQLHPDHLLILDKIIERVSVSGIDAWFDSTAQDWLSEADALIYDKVNDVLDVWFDAGVSHQSVLAARDDLSVPADLYLEGSDQYRGWFQTALLTRVAMTGQAPYRSTLTHGFTVDDKGHKMSKSLGNVIAPDKVIKTLGADVLRLWIASTDYCSELTVSQGILNHASDMYRRIRNTARYLLANLADFDPGMILADEQLLALDKWAISRAATVQADIIKAYEDYQYHIVCQKLQHFCSVDMGSFYLDIIKDRQYTVKKDSIARLSAQTAMYHIIQALVRWISPILSFTSDEIWQHIPDTHKADSVFLTTWYEKLTVLESTAEMNHDYWEQVIVVREEVNKALEQKRQAGEIRSALDVVVTLYVTDPNLYEKLDLLGDELRFVLITSGAILSSADSPNEAIETAVPGVSVLISVSGDPKCVRCWQHQADVCQTGEYVGLCARCMTNVAGKGEQRQFA